MGTQSVSFSKALPHGTIPESYQEEQPELGQTTGVGANFHFSTRDVMSDFVCLLKENPKVWAVAANGDQSGINVWTYIDSTERRDREPVYKIEWELMKRYPDVAFDFSTILAPGGSLILEPKYYTYLYRR